MDKRCRDDLKGDLKNFSNFNEYFLVVALQGSKPTDGYSINITNIIQDGKTLSIKVHLVNPLYGVDVVTSPYHIIKVKKENMVEKGKTKFVFIDDKNGEVLSEKYFFLHSCGINSIFFDPAIIKI